MPKRGKNGNKKCRNYKNRTCIRFDNKNIYYLNYADLARRLKITVRQARQLATGQITKKFIFDKDDNVTQINLKDNFRNILRTKFGIKAIQNKQIFNDSFIKGKQLEIMNKINADESSNIIIYVKLYVNYPSPEPINVSYIIDKNSIADMEKWDKLIHNPKTTNNDLINKIHEGEYKIDYREVDKLIEHKILLERTTFFTASGDKNEIIAQINERVQSKIAEFSRSGGATIYWDFQAVSKVTNKKIDFNDMYAGSYNVYELEEWINIMETKYEKSGANTCCLDYVQHFLPSYKNLIEEIEKNTFSNGIKIGKFIGLLKKNVISYKFYSVDGKLINEHEAKDNDKVPPSINAIIYNNHIYPINGTRPVKNTKAKKITSHLVDDVEERFKKLYKNNIIPKNIRVSFISDKKGNPEFKITSFIHKKDKYFSNPDYEICKTFLDKVSLGELLKDEIRIIDLIRVLEKHYNIKRPLTFIPQKKLFKATAFLWQNKNVNEILEEVERIDDNAPRKYLNNNETFITYDKNKAYPYSLYNLPYLCTFDYRKHKIIKIDNKHKINHSYFYLVKPAESSININKTELIPGYHLIQAMNSGYEFTLLEELQCEIIANGYREIIDLTYKFLDQSIFKNIWNRFIGNLEREISEEFKYRCAGVFTDTAINAETGYVKRIDNDANLLIKDSKRFSGVTDSLLMSIQIKYACRALLYEKIKEIGIMEEKIVQINTDSISFICNKEQRNKLKDEPNNFEGWKISEFKEMGRPGIPYDNDISLINLPNPNPNPRILHNIYAGSGKTHSIMNTYVKDLIYNNKKYIVLTPTHKTLDDIKHYEYDEVDKDILKKYEAENINCGIIQKYAIQKIVPDVDVIIIDEIGFCDTACHNFIYYMVQANKTVICFGDFNQLPPVGETIPNNSPAYLRHMFSDIKTDFVNYRNKFTIEYYDSLINSDNKINLKNEILRWATPDFMKAEVVITYRHITRKRYNRKILKKLGFKKWNSIGVKIMSMNNRLNKKQYGFITNKMKFEIVNIEKDNKKVKWYHLEDLDGKIHKVPEKRLLKNFDMYYAINIHQLQGSSVDSYYWAQEDNHFITPTVAYVVVSRIKQVNDNILRAEENKKFYNDIAKNMHKLDDLEGNGIVINKKQETEKHKKFDIYDEIKELNNYARAKYDIKLEKMLYRLEFMEQVKESISYL